MDTQLLCVFATESTVMAAIKQIMDCYTIDQGKLYILQDVENASSFMCTFNVRSDLTTVGEKPKTVISLHRKKATNTLYTINALNALIRQLNGGQESKKFQVPWENYRNCLLLKSHDQDLKIVRTRLREIVKIDGPIA